METMLKMKFKEHPIGLGISNGGDTLVHLYVSDTGSWTITATDVTGKSCVKAGGRDWLDARSLPGSDT